MDTASRIPTDTHKVTGVGALPRDKKEEGVSRLAVRRTSLPSEEYEGTQPGEKCGGVGSLPGHLSESSVALLPDEREGQAKESVEPSTHATTDTTSEYPHKIDLKATAAHPVKTDEQARVGPTSASSEGKRNPNVPKRKTSLKDKVTDGMKAAMGKLKGDEETFTDGRTQRGH
ncbi:unnamed protein product [Rhizoctonia solani]|uniref:Uncharacterized protein n=3 Tax=Rhizoctonia solani TaxID=456999 RepID=A0A8H3DD45_9AGAM|nr:CsbD domain protein [Rhizoctonia solani AG-3 Rhs1AP]KEP52285.1 CsbD domain protein [Rhizoctonia solani 123E]CAE6525360.1 unnamed protein product [Rhizoctonia solani]CAE6532995.1 unnamed protein product [Rhizoctonia solani]